MHMHMHMHILRDWKLANDRTACASAYLACPEEFDFRPIPPALDYIVLYCDNIKNTIAVNV